ncbi:P-loop containing nucleoside triphosphate hydrolase protein [Pholiota conissans]|uniref:P-loop containing nucleoside triphosphate hydrolase protein n=1 Tax=Pholiota conissans TaxID=109636 RepID=A0A9P5YQG0_9AGAR|nr:P-loop containing nucleoside triphosphate hydrolase protein [Pholiota conissans]
MSSNSILNNELQDSPSSLDEKAAMTRDSQPDNGSDQTPHITPSTRLLFSFIPRKHVFTFLISAIIVSVVAGGVAPFMTFVVGEAFDAFSLFSLTPNPPQSAKDLLLRDVGIAALELIGLALGSFALSSFTSCLWIWVGEINTMNLRQTVYHAVSQKKLSWFDNHSPVANETDGTIGAGGLMAKFSRETDEVRMASSLAAGMLVQYLTTCIACLILAFLRSWSLTLVILSAVPILTFIQGLSQGFTAPILTYEREQIGIAATIVERTFAAIATVKAFNAAGMEHTRASIIFGHLHDAAAKLNCIWAVTSGVSQFVMMAMFVQGFWFGSKLVREGHASAGDVMTVFWACLIATSNLQMCIPQLIVFTKGKNAMAALLELVESSSEPPAPSRPKRANKRRSEVKPKPTQKKFSGGLALQNVSFAYPSRPETDVLSDVSVFLPSNEMTFVVGGSGSGKSTIAHLLLGLYTPQYGRVELDGVALETLDAAYIHKHIACVGQQGAAGVVVFEGKTFWENIAAALLGHSQEAPTTEDVENACRAALMHEFVRDLPRGYDTILGGGAGVGLSGGQKQRLAIARARLRDPPVLILDEATSALDATSRVLVFEAIKEWRKNKTTIIITHDLSQIQPSDFVYVLKDGYIAEQGYRSDLEDTGKAASYKGHRGEFRKMLEEQSGSNAEGKLFDEVADSEEYEISRPASPASFGLLTTQHGLALRPMSSIGNWVFDVAADLGVSLTPRASHSSALFNSRSFAIGKRTSMPLQSLTFADIDSPSQAITKHEKRVTLQDPMTATTATFTNYPRYTTETTATTIDIRDDALAMEQSAVKARQARRSRAGSRKRRSASQYVDIEKHHPFSENVPPETQAIPTFWTLVLSIYSSIPTKPLLFLGLFICILSGAVTPLFSFLLSRLLFEVSIGAQDTSTINFFGGLVLGVAAIDGLFIGLKYIIMETCAMSWVTHVRKTALSHVLAQDKAWFDRSAHAPASLVQVLIKDAEDARDLISVVWGQCFMVCAMLGVGLVWAFVKGWQLTLAGLAIAPVFAVSMAIQSRLVAKCEMRNKRAREEVARWYYDTIINIRPIRAMGFDGAFIAQFEESLGKSLTTGVRGAFVEGCTHGIASALIYLAEALLFYIGALLIARGTYTYLQMVEVLDLVVFTVTIGSQLLAFTEKIARSTQAACDLRNITELEMRSSESRGNLRPPIRGTIDFNQVSFSYPERQSVTVLRSLNLRIYENECVAIVGSSGCGKSTIASLLQRLYEPTSGCIAIGNLDTRLMNVHHLRDHVSIVSQQPHLFDSSIAENIRYGHPAISDEDVRCAAKAANIHDFIVSLPQGYRTTLGENASLISGGQAQRLQIARALARPSSILILDECTSSLDSANRAAILQTIQGVKEGRTTIMITHDMEAMRVCDRILVLQDGGIVEEGSYRNLIKRKGVFATLARGGEWIDR